MLQQCIILAGGFGTRLQEVVKDVPKPMAPVNSKPFLEYIFSYLKHYEIKKVVLSVGYLSEIIQNHFKNKFDKIKIEYAFETEPLGTGGGIRLALEKCNTENVLVLNGDTFFDVDIKEFYTYYQYNKAAAALALRKTVDSARYGTIELNNDNRITNFKEKTENHVPGYINGGCYILNRNIYLKNTPENKSFSIEKDFFETKADDFNLYGYLSSGYFIDIGIPTDYAKAQNEFKEFKY
jgi:D-glycero-alpha-D-manno-heptose 1-phosphate guanylyltransferase